MAWQDSISTFVLIFSVGRGNAAFIRTGLNQGFIVDMASGDDEFSTVEFIKKNFLPKLDDYHGAKIAQAVLSHPHYDHIAECEHLEKGQPLHPKLLTCPHDKNNADGSDSGEKLNWKRIENPDYACEAVETYRELYNGRRLPLQTIEWNQKRTIPNLEYGIFYVKPPVGEKLHKSDDNAYGNSTSLVFFMRHGVNTILLPGDITPEGMTHLLTQAEGTETRYTVFSRTWSQQNPNAHQQKTLGQPSLSGLLQTHGLSILVTPHHGLKSCFCPTLYKHIKGGKPQLNVISERRKKHENDGECEPFYQSADGASGLDVTCEGTLEKQRRSVTTVHGHHILIELNGTGVPKVWLEKDANKLIAIMDGKAMAKASGW